MATAATYKPETPSASRFPTVTNVATTRNRLTLSVELSKVSEGALLRLVECLFIIRHEHELTPPHVAFQSLLIIDETTLSKSKFNHSHIGVDRWLRIQKSGEDAGLFNEWLHARQEETR